MKKERTADVQAILTEEKVNTSVQNRKTKDNGAKLIFDDPILCAQFLRGYTNIDILKNVQPEDIEDISERFLPMWQESRDSDSVKRVRLQGEELFLIAIVEHQSRVHYDMAFKILRYMVMVLTDYETEQEKKKPESTKRKDFKYPPILPIIYYEGSEKWTAARNFQDRVELKEVLGKYIPSFEYIVVPLTSYSDQELLEKEDELSLLMLVNKLRSAADFKKLKDIPQEYFDKLSENTPEYLLQLIGKIVAVLLSRINLPREEVEQFTDRIERREFDMLFDSFEGYDIQETRRVSREEGREEGVAIGEERGRRHKLEEIIQKKLAKGKTPEEIAEALEEDVETIEQLIKEL